MGVINIRSLEIRRIENLTSNLRIDLWKHRVIDFTALLIWFDDSTYLILESEERTDFAVPFVQSFRQETVAPVLALSTSSNSTAYLSSPCVQRTFTPYCYFPHLSTLLAIDIDNFYIIFWLCY